MFYIQTGLKTSQLQEIKTNKKTAFQWLSEYPIQQLDNKNQKTTKARYFLSGYIEQDDKGRLIRNDNNVIRRDLLCIDFDDITMATNQFITYIHNKLKQFNYMIYQTISHTANNPRFRVVIEPARPLLKHEYYYMIDVLKKHIGLPFDHTSKTFSQVQGLPVTVGKVEHYIKIINHGKAYPVPQKIEQPKKRAYTPQQEYNHLPNSKALNMIKRYITNNRHHLEDYTNALSCLMVLAKAVIAGEIDKTTALQGAELVALGKSDWIENNKKIVLNEIKKANGNISHFTTDYSFSEKFSDNQNTITYNEKGKPYKTLPNMLNMVRAIVPLVYNEFNKSIEILQGDKTTTPLTSDDKAMLIMAVAKRYGVRMSKEDINIVVVNLAKEKTYNPIKRLIELKPWDKTPRAETFFIRHLGIKDNIYNREITRKWLLGAVNRIYKEGIKFDMTLVLQGEQGTGKSTSIEKLAMGYYTAIDEDITKDTILKIFNFWIIELEEMDLTRKAENKKVKSFLSATKDDIRRPYKETVESFKRHNVFIGTTNEDNYLKDHTGNRRYYPLRVNKERIIEPIFNVKKTYIQQIWAEVFTWYQNNEPLTCSQDTEDYINNKRDDVLIVNQTLEDLKTYLSIDIPITFYKADLFTRRLYINDMMTTGHSRQFEGVRLVSREVVTTREIMEELYNMKVSPDFKGDTTSRNINSSMNQIKDWKKTTFRRNKTVVKGYKKIHSA